jgi:acyl carrier protein
MGLDSVELVMKVEESYDISIPDDDAEKLITVGKLHEYVVAAVKRKGRKDLDPQTILTELRTIIAQQLGVNPKEIKPESHFVKDLQLDKR